MACKFPTCSEGLKVNTADQKYRLEFFAGEVGDKVETKVETTGDRLIEAIGQVPDSAIQVTIIDLNRLEALEGGGYFFYYLTTAKRFHHMVDIEAFPASKAASDWWNEYIGGKLTWEDEASFASGYDYCKSGSQRLPEMGDAWLAGYDKAAAEHREYCAGLDDEQVAIRCGWAVGVTVTCIKDGAKLKGTVTAIEGGNADSLASSWLVDHGRNLVHATSDYGYGNLGWRAKRHGGA